ncbi:tripartite tricarboxylate transporter substrate binding protein [Roseomonas sp. SSH11]|uniref:Tripartite tricarboxylate transporter substrate binding protein n=1 Tax=Pararoseomonas baculiformis TaxID=2820812 RepID=A0ABS4ADY6_9PROT|nr:tripartite tricarboxylate transporter substrate binding protein [Pararoseomonas baculiformis]MBP0445091.1 tripartite tricarboxylate transporter substrate binding protein [Pararoseomonas baculiformis]
MALARPALAQGEYPNRPIRIIVPYAAGGGQDITARLVSEPLRAALGQPVVVENRTGAGGMIGAQAVATAAPDGYTFLLGGAGETAVAHHLYREKMAYDSLRDLRPVSLIVKVPNILMGSMNAPFKTVAELVEYARANPGQLSYSSSGIGNPQHLAGELFNRMAGIQTVHVPYRGSGPAVTDIAAGQVQYGYNSLASGLSLIRDGRIRAVAVTSRERLPQMPDVPSVSEYAPLAEYELINWFGVFAPGNTPGPIVERVSAALAAALREPELRGKFEVQGLLPQSMTPAEYRSFVTAESEKFGRIVREANITVDS